MVKEGKIKRTNKIRLIRDGIVIYSGDLGSLKRFKEDVKEVVLLLGAYMIKLAGKGENIEENKNKMLNQISNGEALNKFKELVERQGGDVSYIENIEKFKKAKYKMAVISIII